MTPIGGRRASMSLISLLAGLELLAAVLPLIRLWVAVRLLDRLGGCPLAWAVAKRPAWDDEDGILAWPRTVGCSIGARYCAEDRPRGPYWPAVVTEIEEVAVVGAFAGTSGLSEGV
jgi:hypothetical protein